MALQNSSPQKPVPMIQRHDFLIVWESNLPGIEGLNIPSHLKDGVNAPHFSKR